MVEGTLRVVRDDAGIWNRLTPEDSAIAVNQLNESAREHIMESDLKRQAEENFMRRLREEARKPEAQPGKDRWF